MKKCAHCEKEIDARKKFCSDSCKYRYNSIKKDAEAGLPPMRKRSALWFECHVGVRTEHAKGKRSGSYTKGGMAAAVDCQIIELKPATAENIKQHFQGCQRHKPSTVRLGNGQILSAEEAFLLFDVL